jgi:hypothetical protein
MELSQNQKATFSSIKNFFLNDEDNEILIANNNYIYSSKLCAIYEKKDGKWCKVDEGNKIHDYFNIKTYISDVEGINERVDSLALEQPQNKYKKPVITSEQMRVAFAKEFVRLFKMKFVHKEPREIEWIDDKDSRIAVIKELINDMKKDSSNDYHDLYKSWMIFTKWMKLYEKKEVKLFEELKDYVYNGKDNGAKAGKQIKWATRFQNFFDLLPSGAHTICNFPISYFKKINNDDWNSIIDLLIKYRNGDKRSLSNYL